MNRLKTLLRAGSLLLLAAFARAAADPVTVETKWIVKTFSISTTGVTSATFDIGGFGSAGAMVLFNTGKFNGVDGTTFGAPSVITSTWTNVVGFSYSALPIGGSASLKISQTVKTPVPLGTGIFSGNTTVTSTATFNTPYPASNFFTVPVISTSAAIAIPSGVAFADTFQAQTSNPIFVFTGLTSAATLYFSVDYGIPRPQ